jgi:hypothetical protein
VTLLCSTCYHPDRLAIDTALAAGTALRTVGERFDLPAANLYRHRRDGHLSDVVLAELHGRELQRIEAVQGQAADLYKRVKKLLITAEEADHHGTVLKATREAVRCLELLAHLTPPAPVAAQLEAQLVRVSEVINGTVDEYFADDLEANKRFREILSVRFEREGL